MKQTNSLFILSNGRVAAINKKNGEILWEVKLKEYLDTKMTLTIGQINVEENKVYIASTGILICLSAKDGSLIWKNELKGWGYNFVSMANVGNESAGSAAEQAAKASMAAATTVIVTST